MRKIKIRNQDLGAEMNGEKVDIGQDLVKKLAEDPKLKWDFISYESGKEGLENGKYYMMIQIPADFSQKAATVSKEKPEQADILYIPNESRNLLSSQLGERAIKGGYFKWGRSIHLVGYSDAPVVCWRFMHSDDTLVASSPPGSQNALCRGSCGVDSQDLPVFKKRIQTSTTTSAIPMESTPTSIKCPVRFGTNV
ncbi:YhgE/Pip family protein [Effusibacillus consociatus]|uniref:YhgE/Pip family protein n=1 Tax=Effusibacillus consociatus TaxID=1117041 RepID=A0ABV9Q4G1_9BACL